MSSGTRIIGVDFDNTLVTYDELLHKIAVQRGLIPASAPKSKMSIRDYIRHLPDGEIEWQKLQAIAYGPLIKEAKLIDGVQAFFELCKRNGVKAYIVSHKTEFSRYDETRTNLRTAALGWMAANGFFRTDGLGLAPDAVFFGATRQEKIEHIRALGCTHFIDDLEETFREPTFSAGVEKFLYAPHGHAPLPSVTVVATWQALCEHFFPHYA